MSKNQFSSWGLEKLSRVNDGARKIFTLETVEETLALLYCIAHSKYATVSEYAITNPKPTKRDSIHIFPQDMFLFAEGEKMLGMNFSASLAYGEALINAMGVPGIGVTVSLDKNDTIRLSVQVMYEEQYYRFANAYPILCNVVGGTKSQNEKLLVQVVNDALSVARDYFDAETSGE